MTPFWSMEAIVLMRVDSICCIICRKKYSWDEILVSTLNVSSNVIMTEKWRKLLLLFVFHWEMWYVQWLLANLGLSHYWGESEWTPQTCSTWAVSVCMHVLLQIHSLAINQKFAPLGNFKLKPHVHVSIVNNLPWLRWLQLQVEQGWRPLMYLPLAMTTAMVATTWQQTRRECFLFDHQWLQQMSTTTTRGQQRLYCERWAAIETVYSILNIYSMHDTWESLSFPFTTAISPVEHMVCWISVQCVYVTNDVCICFSLSTQFLCCSYPVWDPCIICSLCVVWCACTDCMCLTQARPTTSCIPLVFTLL